MKAKYINPFTDFGFKKIFGEEASKPLLIDFLNALLPIQDKIADLDFKNLEKLGDNEPSRGAVFDIYCESASGQRFIVEMQKARQNFFKDRTVFYSTFPIREQAEKGNWDFRLRPVYCVGLLDFTFDDYLDEPERGEVVHTIKLKDQHGRVFYDKLTYIYLEMPNFRKTEAELVTRLDQWLYFIRNLEDFQVIPEIFRDQVFGSALEKAELAKMSPEEMDQYEHSLKHFRDLKNVVDTAYLDGKEEGREEGRLEGKLEVAKAMKAQGISLEAIAQLTGLHRDLLAGL